MATIKTPYNLELSLGTYILKAIYDDQTLTKTQTVTEGKTMSIDFLFKGKSDTMNRDALPSDIKMIALIFIFFVAGVILIALYKKFG